MKKNIERLSKALESKNKIFNLLIKMEYIFGGILI